MSGEDNSNARDNVINGLNHFFINDLAVDAPHSDDVFKIIQHHDLLSDEDLTKKLVELSQLTDRQISEKASKLLIQWKTSPDNAVAEKANAIIDKINSLDLNTNNFNEFLSLTKSVEEVFAQLYQDKNMPPDHKANCCQVLINHISQLDSGSRTEEILLETLREQAQLIQSPLKDDNKLKDLQFKRAFIAADTEGQAKHQKERASQEEAVLEYGPLNKNVYTYQLEAVIKGMIHNKPFECVFDDKHQTCIVKMHGEEYDMNKILKYANLSHLVFEHNDSKAFLEMLSQRSSKSSCNIATKVEGKINNLSKMIAADQVFIQNIQAENAAKPIEERDDSLLHLSPAERIAIHVYTGHAFNQMNYMLRGDIENSLLKRDSDARPLKTSMQDSPTNAFKEMLCCCGFAYTGLSNLPFKSDQSTYRGEDNLPDHILQAKLDAVKNKSVFAAKELVSTSEERLQTQFGFKGEEEQVKDDKELGLEVKPELESKSKNKVAVLMKGFGASIAAISQVAHEKEVLVAGGQFVYRAVSAFKSPKSDKKDEFIFEAQRVVTLTGLSEEEKRAPTKEEREAFEQRNKIANTKPPKATSNGIIAKIKHIILPPKPSNGLLHANTFLQNGDYVHLMQLTKLITFHNNVGSQGDPNWKIKQNELKTLEKILQEAIVKASLDNFTIKFKPLLEEQLKDFTSNFSASIKKNDKEIQIDANKHPADLTMFHHANYEHHISMLEEIRSAKDKNAASQEENKKKQHQQLK